MTASAVAAMPNASSKPARDMDLGLVRKAMAMRVKYRAAKQKEIPLKRLGVHMMNRGGIYPQHDSVRNLGMKLLGTGFSSSEANHEGVCVEDVPSRERPADLPATDSPPAVAAGFEALSDYNRRNCIHPYLAQCFDEKSDVMYGTLSHSHLVLVLLSILNGANWRVADERQGWTRMLHPDGSFNSVAVAAMDGELASLLQNGLYMEVLSWKIHQEEPTACSLISQSLNNAHQMALRTSELTAMAVLTGAVALELETAVADKVAFETVKEKVRGELDLYVDMPGFIDLFEFVVNMGASRNSFVPQLLEFGSKFVDANKRQLSLSTFNEVNKLPLAVPRVKIAMIMRAYRKPPNKTWCPAPESSWAERHIRSLERLEAILHYFQHTCKSAVAGMDPLKLAVLSANVHCSAADAFIGNRDIKKDRPAILEATAKFYKEIQDFAKEHKREVPKP